MPSIANYYASVGVSTKAADLKKVDRYLELIKKKMDRFSKGLKTSTNIEVKVKLNRSLATQKINQDLKRISDNISLEIKRFTVKHGALARAMNGKVGDGIVVPIRRFQINSIALAQHLNNVLRHLGGRGLTISPKISATAIVAMRQQLSLGLSGIFVNPILSRNFLNQINASIRAMQQLSLAHSNRWYGPGFGMPSMSHFMHFGMASIPFIGGAIGLSSLNRANQENMSTRLTTQAVMQSQGFSEQQGKQSFEWLRNLANQNGFRYMDVAPDYNQFMANSLGAGLGIGQSQDIFRGFNEYGTAMGISSSRRKLVTNAMSQMLGKGKVEMQELRQQMAESMPGTIEIFAKAFAQQKNSGLTGQEAVKALYDAMGKGQVKSAEIMPIVSQIMSQRAQPKLGILRQTSIAEQGRMGNAMDDLVDSFSKAGGESGFARFFRTMTTAFKESDRSVKSMARGFDEISKVVEVALLLPQSVQRMFEGRDSWVKDKLIKDGGVKEDTLDKFIEVPKKYLESLKELWNSAWESLKKLFEKISSTEFFDKLISYFTGFTDVISSMLKAVASLLRGDWKGAWSQMTNIAELTTKPIRTLVGGAIGGAMELPNSEPVQNWWNGVQNIGSGLKSIYELPSQMFENQPNMQYEKPVPESALPSTSPPEASNSKAIDVQVKAQIDVSGAQNPEEVSKMLDDKLTSTWRDALLQFGNYT